jgi:hypothetical protein
LAENIRFSVTVREPAIVLVDTIEFKHEPWRVSSCITYAESLLKPDELDINFPLTGQ